MLGLDDNGTSIGKGQLDAPVIQHARRGDALDISNLDESPETLSPCIGCSQDQGQGQNRTTRASMPHPTSSHFLSFFPRLPDEAGTRNGPHLARSGLS